MFVILLLCKKNRAALLDLKVPRVCSELRELLETEENLSMATSCLRTWTFLLLANRLELKTAQEQFLFLQFITSHQTVSNTSFHWLN